MIQILIQNLYIDLGIDLFASYDIFGSNFATGRREEMQYMEGYVHCTLVIICEKNRK